MNLTQTKRWSEFAEWYYDQKYEFWLDGMSDTTFVKLQFEFQEGVYRKFIRSKLKLKHDSSLESPYSVQTLNCFRRFKTFKQLITWFFNN